MYFITSNSNKVREAIEILGLKIEKLDLDLAEIQSVKVEEVIRKKIDEAKRYCNDNFFVEDTALYLGEKLEVGALIKFFPNDRIVKAYLGESALAVCCLGLRDGELLFGQIKGKIVAPRGENGFGWDAIFEPDGYNRTFAEMTSEEKNKISHRRQAFKAFKKILKKNS